MEVFDGVHRIESTIGNRPLRLFFFRGERTLLFDAGVATTPAELIVPELRAIGVAPSALDFVVISHADGDHCGGCAALCEQAPGAVSVCGRADRAMIEDPERLIADRVQAYRSDHGIALGEEQLAPLRPLMGAPTSIDIAAIDGEIVRLSADWEIELVATPGHSKGHLALYDRRHDALFTADAVHGRYYPDLAGDPAMPPNYVDVDDYLSTIDRLQRIRAAHLHGAHWPACSGDEVSQFLEDSRDHVQRLESAVADALADASGPITLLELIERVNARLDRWSPDHFYDLALSIAAHVERRVRNQLAVRASSGGEPVVYRSADL